MAERAPDDHLRAAMRRLSNAYDLYHQVRSRPYDEVFLELADVAMLVWSAGVDLTSALMLLDGRSALGTSARRREYLTQNLHAAYPDKELRSGWRHLARLHNFQHNLDMPQSQFEVACHGSGGLIVELTELLPEGMRLPPESCDWLLNMG